MSDGLSRRELKSFDNARDITIWLSDDIPIGQWDGLRGGPDKRSDAEIPIVQAHSTTYHPQTNGLVERQNRTLVNMLRVYCSRYMTVWDKYLPQVVGAKNSTQHSTIGVTPFMMLTGRERAMPLTFFYPEKEGKETSLQAYVKEAVRRH